jgi:hypothetical protein
MLKKLLIVMGVLSTGFIASCALLLGVNATSDAPRNKALAERITRDLARSWNVSDVAPYFLRSGANQVNFAAAQASFNPLRPLGQLKRIDEAQQTGFFMEANVGEGVAKNATVTMVATFEHGRADVTMELRSEAGQMRLRSVNVTPKGPLPAPGQPA